jgi:hypothetical protein
LQGASSVTDSNESGTSAGAITLSLAKPEDDNEAPHFGFDAIGSAGNHWLHIF